MTDFVIDSSSILAFVFDEPGGEMVTEAARHGDRLFISAVNVGEIYAKLTDKGFLGEEIDDFLGPLDLEIIPLDRVLARISGRMRQQVDRSLSLGDRCCLALGMEMAMPVMTADREWLNHAKGLGLQMVITRPA